MEQLNYNNIKLKFINEEDDFSNLVKKGISFDEEGMCYNDVDDIDSYIEKVKNSFVVYGIYYGNELIGISMIGQVDSLDPDKFAISINIKKEYRGKKIGSLCLPMIVDSAFSLCGAKSLHVCVRTDNAASNKIVKNMNFKLYSGYKDDETFVTKTGKVIDQNQYILDYDDYINIK